MQGNPPLAAQLRRTHPTGRFRSPKQGLRQCNKPWLGEKVRIPTAEPGARTPVWNFYNG